ncbi:MAG: acyl-ACP--UDP-N-acetylglucosamine O-acyltransferase [Verrucomicrobiota bacterium]|nr:acyl-ACP--UDP-N-acetylglucosamine O-acyltransferase [Verrucomicrobiota bacterium]
MNRIHATAFVDPDAQVASSAEIGPFAVVEAGVIVGENCVIGPHAVLRSGVILAEGVGIDAHAVIGGLPQDLRFDPKTISGVRIGANTAIREGVTIHRATRAGSFTEIGANVLIMAYAHVAHDCRVEDRVVLVNNVMLAGHVWVGPYAFLGGGASFHQNARIGESAMVSGLTRGPHDVAPFTLVAERCEVHGLNLVGIKRRGFGQEVISELKAAYKAVYGQPGNRRHFAQAMLDGPHSPHSPQARQFLEFFIQPTKRGYSTPVKQLKTEEAP